MKYCFAFYFQSSSISFSLCLPVLWAWKMELVNDFPTCRVSEKELTVVTQCCWCISPFRLSSIVDCFPQSFFLCLIFSVFFISNGSKHHFTYRSFPESWCQCWKGIWMCLVEGNSVSPFSEPSNLWSTSSSSLSARGCSTLSKFCGSTFKQNVLLLCSFC